jgi:hypothetical protein
MEPDSEAFDPNFKKSLLLDHARRSCLFYIDNCIFTSSDSPKDCLPCGGLVFLSKNLGKGRVDEPDLRLVNLSPLGDSAYVSLFLGVTVKRFEQDYIHQTGCFEI